MEKPKAEMGMQQVTDDVTVPKAEKLKHDKLKRDG
jgi:hypothetical protein